MTKVGQRLEEHAGMDEEFTTVVEQVKDCAFKVIFDKETYQPLTVDETKPVGGEMGPNPSRMVSGAVGHCLSASLVFCLKRSRIELKHLATKVHTRLARNEEGRWRIENIKVEMKPELADDKDQERIKRCLEIFQDFCIVTQSVRRGIDVQVTVHTEKDGP